MRSHGINSKLVAFVHAIVCISAVSGYRPDDNNVLADVLFRRFFLVDIASTSATVTLPIPTHPHQQTDVSTAQTTRPTDGIIIPTKFMTSSMTSLTTPAYCQNRHSISCGFDFKIVCGSDGKLYANLCMLALGRCDNPALTQVTCSSG